MDAMKQTSIRLGSRFLLVGIGILSLFCPGSSPAGSNEPADKSSPAKEPITYAKQVSRILQNRCQTCHHPGTAAPFSLLTYEDAVNWSQTIREVLLDKRMPPWHADPRYGHFSNDRRLPKEELAALLGWLDTGLELGDKGDLPP